MLSQFQPKMRREKLIWKCWFWWEIHELLTIWRNCWKIQMRIPRMLNVEGWMLKVECWILNVEGWMLNVECWMLNIECWMLNVECWMLNVECWMLKVKCRMLNVECWMLNVFEVHPTPTALKKNIGFFFSRQKVSSTLEGKFRILEIIGFQLSTSSLEVRPSL